MAGPNDRHRQGGHKPPPSVIASAPASAPEVEPVRSAPSAVASPAPAIAEPAQANVALPGALAPGQFADGAAKLAQMLAAEPSGLVLPTMGAPGAARAAASTFVFVEDASPSAKPEVSGGIDIAEAAESLRALADSAKAGEPAAVLLDGVVVFDGKVAAEPAQVPPVAPPVSYVAVCPIFVGGQRGRIEPGEAYKPASDVERDMLLAQRVIRAS